MSWILLSLVLVFSAVSPRLGSAQPSLTQKEKATVLEAKDLYAQAMTLYGQGNVKQSRSLFNKAAKRLASLGPDAHYALKNEYADFFSQLEAMEVARPKADLAISEEELDAAKAQTPIPPAPGLTIPMPTDDPLVQKYITLYTTTERRETLQKALARSGRYRDMILGVLKEYKLPHELMYLPVVESRYDLNDVSWVGAVGLWQFMPGTGRNYGMQVSFWLDERRDPEKSTRAAAKYLKELYEYFNDWHLALAAYNRGENGIARDLKFTKTTGFDGLAQHDALPKETEHYVPQFVAVTLIAQNLEKYGFNIEYEKPEGFDTVQLDKVIDLEVAAQCAETTVQELRRLNPAIVAWCTPKNYTPYPLRLPAGSKDKFLANSAKVENWTPSRGVVKYKIKKGDILGRIAQKFDTTARAIQETNNIKNPKTLRLGQTLTIQPGRRYWND